MTSALVPLERPPSEQLVDLHVYLVPTEVWNEKYHSAYNDVISQTISAGFVRVWPELSLYYLRNQIIDQLGYDVLPPDYVFLKSVGRCLTQVKTKQEFELKVKNFIPPQVILPELFVLEAKRDDLSLASFQESELDSHRSNHDRMDIIEEKAHSTVREERVETQPSEHQQGSTSGRQLSRQKKLSKIPRKLGSNIGTKASIQSGNQTGKVLGGQASQQTGRQPSRQMGEATVKLVGKQPVAKVLGNRTVAKKATGIRSGTQKVVVGKRLLARKVAGAKPPLHTASTTAQSRRGQAREIANKVVIGGRTMRKSDQAKKQVGIRTEDSPGIANQQKGVARGVPWGAAHSDEGTCSSGTGCSNPTWNSQRERTGQEYTASNPGRTFHGGVPPLPLQHLEPIKGVDPASPLKSGRPDTYTNNTNEDSGIAELEYGRHGNDSLERKERDEKRQGQGTFLVNSREEPEGGRVQPTEQSRLEKNRQQHLEDGTPLPTSAAAYDAERRRQVEAREKQQQDREKKINEDAAREREHKERQLEKENQRQMEKRKKEREDVEERQRLFKARQQEIDNRLQQQAEAKRLQEEDEEKEMEEEIRKRQADELKQSRQMSHQEAKRKEREEFTPHSQRGGSRQQKGQYDAYARDFIQQEERFGGNTRQSNRTQDERVTLADETGGSAGNDGSLGSDDASPEGGQSTSGVSRGRLDSEGERILAKVQELQERRYLLESEREELMRFAKTLQSRMIDRRNKVRDLWKKRYFEEKKKTNPLEERVNRLRGQLDQQHRKLLSHLEGKGAYQKGAPRTNAPPSKKNDHKILIIKTKHSMEDLRRRVENSKMKLTSEIKLRNQAETELRNLRSEVIQRKINVTVSTSKSKLQGTMGRDEGQPSRSMATRGTGVSITPQGSQKRGVKF